MRRLYRHTCSLLLLLSLTVSLQAQPAVRGGEVPVASEAAQARFEHFTVADGLPENSVRTMLQDRFGFLWFGTQNGLARYDGQAMTVFQPDSDDPYSIGGSSIAAFYEDRAGDLWIGTTRNGLVNQVCLHGRLTPRTIFHRRRRKEQAGLMSQGSVLLEPRVDRMMVDWGPQWADSANFGPENPP